MAEEKMTVAAIQMRVDEDKQRNLDTAEAYVKRAKEQGAEIAVLPEMFCCPYQTEKFPIYAEEEGGNIWQRLSGMARNSEIYLIAGSMPERGADGDVFNTSYVFDRTGRQIGKHRKIHLFDIDVAGGQYFKESDTLTAGDSVTVFDTELGTMGVCICYDIRFPELFRSMALRGARMVFVPAAFNMTTGPVHWELTFRARALDNQIYVMGCAPMRDSAASYISWGHSIAVDPWGKIMGQLDEKEGILMAEVDWRFQENVRGQLPLLRHRRPECYFSPKG